MNDKNRVGPEPGANSSRAKTPRTQGAIVHYFMGPVDWVQRLGLGTYRWASIILRRIWRIVRWLVSNALPVLATTAGLLLIYDRATGGGQQDFHLPKGPYQYAMTVGLVVLFLSAVIPAWIHRRNTAAELELDAMTEFSQAVVDDMTELANTGEAFDWRDGCTAYAKMLSKLLGLTGDERVSVYLYSKSRGVLIRAGRWSENNALRVTGRSVIPLRGIAKRAIDRPIAHRDIILWDPIIRPERYRKAMVQTGTFHEERDLDQLTMLSRNYMVVPVLQCQAGQRGTSRAIGVVIFESNHPFRFFWKARYVELVRRRHDLLELTLNGQAPHLDQVAVLESFDLPSASGGHPAATPSVAATPAPAPAPPVAPTSAAATPAPDNAHDPTDGVRKKRFWDVLGNRVRRIRHGKGTDSA